MLGDRTGGGLNDRDRGPRGQKPLGYALPEGKVGGVRRRVIQEGTQASGHPKKLPGVLDPRFGPKGFQEANRGGHGNEDAQEEDGDFNDGVESEPIELPG